MDCIWCSVELTDENWYTSSKKKKDYKCKACIIKKETEYNAKKIYINGKYISRKDPRYSIFKPGNYKNIGDAIFEQSGASNIKEGHVYVITNPAWSGWVKIGMAIDAEDRLNSYQTSSPMRDFVLEHYVASNDKRKSEKEAHTKALPLSTDAKGEWFKLSIEQAITILDNLDEQHRTVIKADKNPQEDELQERPKQTNFWDLTKDFQPS
jgi:hypothetical protein